MLTPDWLRETCLQLPGAFEDFPFDPWVSVFKVQASPATKAKMFALSDLKETPLQVSLKCEPALASQLRVAHPEITGAWHLNKTHWNGVRLDGALERQHVAHMIEDSYDLVVASLPARDRAKLGWTAVVNAETTSYCEESNDAATRGAP